MLEEYEFTFKINNVDHQLECSGPPDATVDAHYLAVEALTRMGTRKKMLLLTDGSYPTLQAELVLNIIFDEEQAESQVKMTSNIEEEDPTLQFEYLINMSIMMLLNRISKITGISLTELHEKYHEYYALTRHREFYN